MIERIQDTTSIVISGHRGYKSAYPENTLLAFQEALKLGVDMLEFDLRFSKDGALVVIHDETVDRTTNGSGPVSDHTLAELKQLDAGGWFGKPFEGLRIPTFEELCQLLKPYPDVLLNVEVKSSKQAKEVADAAVALLREYGLLPRCVFTCFDADIIAYFHDTHQVRTQGFPGEVMSNFIPEGDGTYSKMWAIAFHMGGMTPKSAEEFRSKGLQVWCYCPDNEQQVHYALGCGVSVMTCNDPVPAMELRRRILAP